ncbi:aminotransferase class V-fold PLP-dependent enzyme [Arthrobacter sp. 18067]|uniref:aminotransferase class V-fold PLP-dependent enzyme n=1 Tax=Arthrobacter sp. 18067 TaxID=2681413 RepID=UPI00135A365C|nr:aminotransferase class V-fold PLP-dependent enzyme [Arthrobacter sp. 18067]
MTDLSASAMKALYPGTGKQIYLDAAAVGIISERVSEAMRRVVDEHQELGIAATGRWRADIGKTRESVARLVGSAPERISFTQNTSTGIALVRNGIQWREGDNVVLPRGEFPSNSYPWLELRQRGVEVRQVDTKDLSDPETELLRHVDQNTRVLAISAVQYSTGYRYKLEKLGSACRSRETLLVVDGTQAVGALEIRCDELGVDALCVSAHKWLLGPFGIGFVSFSDKAMKSLQPSVTGWLSVEDPFAFTPEPQLANDGRRFESGTENIVGIAALEATISIIHEYGTETIERDVIQKTERLDAVCQANGLRSLRSTDRSTWSGILLVTSDRNDQEIFEYLSGSGVKCSLRKGAIRLSPHYYNSSDDIDEFGRILAKFTAGQ